MDKKALIFNNGMLELWRWEAEFNTPGLCSDSTVNLSQQFMEYKEEQLVGLWDLTSCFSPQGEKKNGTVL